MKNKITAFIALITATLLLSGGALALTSTNSVFAAFIPACSNTKVGVANNTPVCSDVNRQTTSGNNVFIRIIKDVIDILSFAVGVAAVIIIIVSAIRFITSGGDSNATTGAKKGLMGAVIGIFVVVLAQTIVLFVLDRIK